MNDFRNIRRALAIGTRMDDPEYIGWHNRMQGQLRAFYDVTTMPARLRRAATKRRFRKTRRGQE